MSDKVRCESSRVKSLDLTFAADKTSGNFEWSATLRLLYHFLDSVDVSVDAVGAVAYEVEDVLVPKTTGQTWSIGQRLFYTPGANSFRNTTSSAKDIVAGIALEAAGTAATEGRAHFVGDPGRRPQMEGAGM